MDNNSNMLQLCRLCLVKDDVNIPIFEEQGDIRQIFLKISSCLPVKVSRDDQLPKKICDGCSYKLDMLYEFWNTSANAEKQLLTWLGEAGMTSQMADGTISAVAQQIKPADAFVKQETIDPPDIHMDDDDDEDKDYMKQEENSTNVEEPPPKRARRTAAVKAAIALDQNSDDDDDSGEPMTKIEDDSEDSDNDDREPAFVDVPSTSADDQPGPSGVGKDGVEAPTKKSISKKKKLLKKTRNYVKSKSTLTCDLCKKTFKQYSRLKTHLLAHSTDRPFPCELCNKTFKRKYDMSVHLKVHGIFTTLECDICSKKLKSKSSYVIHRKRHLKEYVAKCEICNQGFVTRQEYNNHMGFKHGTSSFVCNICGTPCYDKSALISHMSRHSDNYNHKFVCETCGKKLYSKVTLQEHIVAIHQGLKPHKCDVCNHSFANRLTLRLHKRRHTGEKPYSCTYCFRAFTQSHSLKIHLRLHTGEKPEICSICESGFTSKSMLKSHMKTKHKLFDDAVPREAF